MRIPQEKKGGKTIDLHCYIKILRVKPEYQQMTLSPKVGVVGISTLWHFRLNCWFSSAPVFQWCCSTPQGSPGVGRNTFLSSPHLCFIIVFICDLFVSRDDPLMS